MEKGLTSQFTNSVTPMPLTCLRTSPKAPKSTFTSMGMTITQINRPTGRFTLAYSMPPIAWNIAGKNWPRAMPAPMHSSTQTVR